MKKLLFICSRNRLRSPTAESVFGESDGFETASAGLNHDANQTVTPELLQWADVILVMERGHRHKLSQRFQPYLKNKQVICLDIPDKYGYMDAELIHLLKQKVSQLLRI
jgi:predicted protein tyrosine phosphatase